LFFVGAGKHIGGGALTKLLRQLLRSGKIEGEGYSRMFCRKFLADFGEGIDERGGGKNG
jgi:hypothetical protein